MPFVSVRRKISIVTDFFWAPTLASCIVSTHLTIIFSRNILTKCQLNCYHPTICLHQPIHCKQSRSALYPHWSSPMRALVTRSDNISFMREGVRKASPTTKLPNSLHPLVLSVWELKLMATWNIYNVTVCAKVPIGVHPPLLSCQVCAEKEARIG